MELKNPIDYIVLGGVVRYLAGRAAGDLVFGDRYIYANIGRLKRYLKKLEFSVSYSLAVSEFKSIEKELLALKDDGEKESSIKVTKAIANNIVDKVLSLEKTIWAESGTRIIASPVPRRFDLDHLLSSPGDILGKGIYERLTDLARSDINQACRCIAFECPTAAAFHVLRAVEECVRIVYKSYFPRGDEKRPWGRLTAELKEKQRKPIPDPILLGHLDHMRQRFRNPTDHPEKNYEIEEAEDLIHIAVDIINRCIKDPKVAARIGC
mgnify:CR=1 FL=1